MLKKLSIGIALACVATVIRVAYAIWAVSIIFSLLGEEYGHYMPFAVMVVVAIWVLRSTNTNNSKISDDNFILNIAEDFVTFVGTGFGLCLILVIAKYIVIWWFGI